MVNVFVVQGNLVADPTVRTTKAGNVCNFRIANNTNKDKPLFVDVAVWGRQGDICNQYLKKGRSVVATGPLSMDTWGDNKTSLVINAFKVDFMGDNKKVEVTEDVEVVDAGDEIPF